MDGFGFTGYRSFHGELQLFAPLGKVNLLAGQNNAGKSNVLRFAAMRMRERTEAPSGYDVPLGDGVNTNYSLQLQG